ncbi:MAG: hypothetical protein KUA35_09265 [Pseudodesulfovibrio sp.]|uniref:hypothetical protein n=1 Tax=Pseudodesulfovibrio TaxID=2035811 RepID=UPI00059E3725|nr:MULTISPECIES: hypothetical protein [Pseudodesulfovibrio]MBU4378880.1 hypothetical protein [Pseudomonadota bacterium]MCG2742005.1 hypothetical protein [Syntrophaceae bacterium]MBU4475258.1 hypothetical protein [Pseudomonadota bacterium]MBU4516295.1 hypothetical protein [Pseudomonadota bacterium]MBU4522476.1 hypothetical protein [Pseudomonadota bacterium]
MNESIIEQLRAEMPAIFAGKTVDEYTGGAVRWRTLQNMKARGEFPQSILLRFGKKDVIQRDRFLEWLKETFG